MRETERREVALRWRVRFRTPDGMYALINISKSGGFKLDRAEVEDWAQTQVRSQPDKYDSVAAVLNLDASLTTHNTGDER